MIPMKVCDTESYQLSNIESVLRNGYVKMKYSNFHQLGLTMITFPIRESGV